MRSPAVDTSFRLNYEVHDGSGPYLFLLHGLLSSRLQWSPNLAALAAVARPVTFELWGHGRSPTPEEDVAYRIDSYVSQLDCVRKTLGASKIILCGQSFGACVTLRYSIKHPDHVTAQIFTNSASALAHDDPSRREAIADAVERYGAEAIASLSIHPRRARRLPVPLRDQMAAEADRVNPLALIKSMRITARDASVAADLHLIDCPTLLINGSWESPFQPLRVTAARGIARCQVVDLPAGHAVNLELPTAFNCSVIRFISALGQPGKQK
jgi:pimeloyl-ACP methyl ester carboxylesterase